MRCSIVPGDLHGTKLDWCCRRSLRSPSREYSVVYRERKAARFDRVDCIPGGGREDLRDLGGGLCVGFSLGRDASMLKISTKDDLQRLIDDEIQESLTLDYKASPSLGKDSKPRDELC